MDSSRNSLPEALRMLVAESAGPAAAEHPSPDELIAYSERELAGPERQRVQRHLAECPDCAGTVLDLESFPDIELRDESLRRSDEEEAADWNALEQRLALTPPAPVAVRPSARPYRTPRRSFEFAAAALLAVAVGLGLWVVKLQRQVEALSRELARPQANVFVSDLLPSSRIRNSSETEALRLPAGTRQLVLILNLADLRPFPDHQVEILDRNGVIFWWQRGFRRGPEGNFSLSLPKSSIPAGPCQIRLYGLAGSRKTPLATYLLQVASEPPGAG